MMTSLTVDWNLLRHAYGDAAGIPALLKQIEEFPAESDWRSEPWFSLWSALYHQGDIFSASIAAVPHIVSALSKAPHKATLSFYLLPASIAVADSANPVEVAREVRHSYEDSMATLGGIAATALPSISDRDIARAAQAVVLASQGAHRQAGDLLEADT